MMSDHSRSSYESSVLNGLPPKRSPFDVLFWFDKMESESTHRLVNPEVTQDPSSPPTTNGLDIEVEFR